MKTHKTNLHTLSYVSAFLMGVILFWSFGKNWLNLGSMPVFIAGVLGVAVPVLIWGVWSIFRISHQKEN